MCQVGSGSGVSIKQLKSNELFVNKESYITSTTIVFVNALRTCSRTFSGKIRLPKMEQTAVSQLSDWTAAGVAASQLKTCTVGD